MSSVDERDSGALPLKKRRIQRACDSCRQRKRACDGSRTVRCTSCVESGIECVYSTAPAANSRQSYTEQLEARIAQMAQVLRKLSVDVDDSGKAEWSKDSPILKHVQQTQRFTREPPNHEPGVEVATRTIRAVNESNLPSDRDEQDTTHLEAMERLKQISEVNDRFLGQSSRVMLFKAASELKEQYIIEERSDGVALAKPWAARRMEYWDPPPWKQGLLATCPLYIFPADDVLVHLVDLYFEHSNIYIPLLHRPTLERGLAEHLHLENPKFGTVLMLVCAVASRFSDDPRVVDADQPLVCGWKYFSQVSMELEFFFQKPVIYDLQRCCLVIQFLDSSAPEAIWQFIGIGIRIATEVGVHRRQVGAHTIEAELWRRAFWALVFYDRLGSCLLGRPCGIQDEDYDVQMPTECDDEYWEDGFRQPPRVPSRVALFTALLKLNNILAICLRFLYSLDKGKRNLALDDNAGEKHLVMELDSVLNKWVDSIPEHLRWDPNRSQHVFFKQSAALYCSYYWVQTTIHRPYIPTVRQTRPTVLPSLAICTNAARSCAHIAEAWSQRNCAPATILLPALTTAGYVLLLNVWSGRRTGLAPHMNTSLAEVRKCMDAIRALEQRWHIAGMFWDILNELAQVGNGLQRPPAPASGSALGSTSNFATSLPFGCKRPRAVEREGESESDGSILSRQPLAVGWMSSSSLEDEQFAWLGDPNFLSAAGSTPTPKSSPLTSSPIDSLTHQESMSTSAAHGHAGHDYGISAVLPPTETNGSNGLIDGDVLEMWLNAPTSLGVDDWGAYLNFMSQLDDQNTADPSL